MKTMNINGRSTLFAGVVDVIAESLGRPLAEVKAPVPANARDYGTGSGTEAVPEVAPQSEPAWLSRAGTWLWRRQQRGVDAYIARADTLFAALDRWLWKQRMRETEAWLAQSADIIELEARIRQLERGPDNRII
jgi:hypothetical protein